MPVEYFDVTVSATHEVIKQESVAIATASQYLAYCDQSDTFGYRGDVYDVRVERRPVDDKTWLIGIRFATQLENEEALTKFTDEMDALAKVESVERLSYAKE